MPIIFTQNGAINYRTCKKKDIRKYKGVVAIKKE